MKKILFVLLFAAAMLSAFSIAAQAQESAIVASYAGDVKITPQGATKAVTCKPGMVIEEGTRIVTGEEAFVMLSIGRGTSNFVKVKEKSEVVVKIDKDEKIQLIEGTMFVFLRELKRGREFRVQTPDAVCGARGTGWGIFTGGGVTTIAVFDNNVFVSGINKDGTQKEKSYWVKSGYKRKVKRFKQPGGSMKLSKEELERMKKEFNLSDDEKIGQDKAKRIEKKMDMRDKQMERLQEKKERIKEDKEEEKLEREPRQELQNLTRE